MRIAEKRSDEEIAILEVQRLIKSQVSVRAEAREYFTEKQLLFIEPYSSKFKESDEEKDWIAKSRTYVYGQKELEKKKQQEELAKTRKRLRTVYSLLGLTLIAIIAAVILYVNANTQKRIAQVALQKNLEFLNKGVGKKYKGGIIFFADSSREHGLIAAEKDLPRIYNWDSAKIACKNYSVTRGDSTYHDWFLPSKDTLNLMYVGIGNGALAPNKNLGGFFDINVYWSSSEFEPFSLTWCQLFYQGQSGLQQQAPQ